MDESTSDSSDRGTLLVVDDEPFLRDAVAASLRFPGFEVATADSGTKAVRMAGAGRFDLVVLDVMLPDTDGFEVVRRLRRDGCQVPVIFLTARDTQADTVAGLTVGGDDYITKPFGLDELAARIRTVLRRTRGAAKDILLPMTLAPGWLRTISNVNPVKHIVDALRTLFHGHVLTSTVGIGLAVGAGLIVVGMTFATRTFQRDSA